MTCPASLPGGDQVGGLPPAAHFCSDSPWEKFKKFSIDFKISPIILKLDTRAPWQPVEIFLGALVAELCNFENHFGRLDAGGEPSTRFPPGGLVEHMVT